MGDKEEVEVTVSVPETPESDTDGDGVPDGVETGQALERATNADEKADEAVSKAEFAQSEAEYAAQTAAGAVAQAADTDARIDAINSRLDQLMGVTEKLVEAMNASAALQLAETQATEPAPLPNEENDPPESRHWLNRRVFGGKR